jgi:hypothetical protein
MLESKFTGSASQTPYNNTKNSGSEAGRIKENKIRNLTQGFVMYDIQRPENSLKKIEKLK